MADLDDGLILLGLDALHQELGARMVPFAGYLKPVHSPDAVL